MNEETELSQTCTNGVKQRALLSMGSVVRLKAQKQGVKKASLALAQTQSYFLTTNLTLFAQQTPWFEESKFIGLVLQNQSTSLLQKPSPRLTCAGTLLKRWRIIMWILNSKLVQQETQTWYF